MRLGIMGGTFDPIHNGHLDIAGMALQEAALDKVLFLPDGDPPHKTPGARGAERMAMVELAIRGMDKFFASDMELKRPGTTYTVDTLLHLKKSYPGYQLYYIIGADTLFLFSSWKTAEKVARLCHILVAPRPGISVHDTAVQQELMLQEYGLHTTRLSNPGCDISSSHIRELIRNQNPVNQFVPGAVAEYIARRGLYGYSSA